MTAPHTHMSAAELASLQLPGLPSTESGIIRRAKGDGWPFVDRIGRGGGRLYAVADLPAEARAAVQARATARVPANLRPVGRPKGSDYFSRNIEVADAVEAILADRQLSAARILELLARRFPPATLPPRRTLARFIQKLESDKPALLAATRNPDLYKGQYKLALGRADGGVTHAHQVWEIDTTKADVLTKGGRKMILGLIDRWSRRARFMVAPSESGQAVRRLLIEAIREWGVVPETVKTDNGSGYINASIVSALDTLGIVHERCLPGTPEDKPYVERLFGTFTRERAELLGGYSGHNVAQAQALRSKAKKETGRAIVLPEMEPEELQAVLNAWVDGVYHQRVHSGINTTPMRRWLSSPVPARRAPSEDTLKIALSRFERVATVGKRGVVWKGGRYWAAALVPFVGRAVQVRRDEEDLGALFIFDEDGHFIDTAVNAERAGLSEQQFAQAAARQQAEWLSGAKAELREKKRRFRFEEARDQLLRDDAERAGKLTYFPTPTVERSTPQLDSIAVRPEPPMPSQARIEEAVRKMEPRRAAPTLSIAEKVAAADRIIGAAERGVEVDPDELKRARLFATTTAYRAEKTIIAHFGGAQTPAANDRRHSA